MGVARPRYNPLKVSRAAAYGRSEGSAACICVRGVRLGRSQHLEVLCRPQDAPVEAPKFPPLTKVTEAREGGAREGGGRKTEFRRVPVPQHRCGGSLRIAQSFVVVSLSRLRWNPSR